MKTVNANGLILSPAMLMYGITQCTRAGREVKEIAAKEASDGINTLAGFPLVLDPDLAPGTLQLRDSSGVIASVENIAPPIIDNFLNGFAVTVSRRDELRQQTLET